MLWNHMGMERFELSTHRLKADYSTAELHTQKSKTSQQLLRGFYKFIWIWIHTTTSLSCFFCFFCLLTLIIIIILIQKFVSQLSDLNGNPPGFNRMSYHLHQAELSIRSDLNTQPSSYEKPAPPLSYWSELWGNSGIEPP